MPPEGQNPKEVVCYVPCGDGLVPLLNPAGSCGELAIQ